MVVKFRVLDKLLNERKFLTAIVTKTNEEVALSLMSIKKQAFNVKLTNKLVSWISSQLLYVNTQSPIRPIQTKPLTVCGERGDRFC